MEKEYESDLKMSRISAFVKDILPGKLVELWAFLGQASAGLNRLSPAPQAIYCGA
jgi:hypothetical protein